MLLPPAQSHPKDGRVKQRPPERAGRHFYIKAVAGVAATEKEDTHKGRHGEDGSGECKGRRSRAPTARGMSRGGRVFRRGKEARGERDREGHGRGSGYAEQG